MRDDPALAGDARSRSVTPEAVAEAGFDLGRHGVVRLNRLSLAQAVLAWAIRCGRTSDDLYLVVAQGPSWRATRATGVAPLVLQTAAANARAVLLRLICRLVRLRFARSATRLLFRHGLLPNAMAIGVYAPATVRIMRRQPGTDLNPTMIVRNTHRRTAVVLTATTVCKLYDDVRNPLFESRLTAIVELQKWLAQRSEADATLPFGVAPVVSPSFEGRSALVVSQYLPGRLVSADPAPDAFERALSIVPALRTELRSWAVDQTAVQRLQDLSLRTYADTQLLARNQGNALVELVEQHLLQPLLAYSASDLALAHGDLWSGNLVEGARLQVIDWDKCTLLPDWYDAFYLTFHEVQRRSRRSYRQLQRNLDPSADADAILGSRFATQVIDRIRAYGVFAAQYLDDEAQVDRLEATYFRLAGVSWAGDTGWPAGPQVVRWLAAHADRLDAGVGAGVMNELLKRV